MGNLSDPASSFEAITPSDTVLGKEYRAVYVGGAGDIAIKNKLGTVVVFTAVPAGSVLPVVAFQVQATNTTATNLVGLF